MPGGFHEDGLADVADGLGGSYDRERALDIMKDSRIGAFGAMALVLALLAKVSLLALLGAHSLGAALAALAGGHVLSRLWPLFIVRWLPHVGDTAQSKSKPLADQISRGALAVAVLWCFLPLALVYQAQAAIKFAAIEHDDCTWHGRCQRPPRKGLSRPHRPAALVASPFPLRAAKREKGEAAKPLRGMLTSCSG